MTSNNRTKRAVTLALLGLLILGLWTEVLFAKSEDSEVRGHENEDDAVDEYEYGDDEYEYEYEYLEDDDDDDFYEYDDDDDDLTSDGLYDGEGYYFYPKREEYSNYEEYDHDWKLYQKFASNHGSQDELSVLLNCSEVHTNDMYEGAVIPDQKRWKVMNEVYHATMAKYRTKEDKYKTFPKKFQQSGLSKFTEIKIAPVVGRGVYATQDIPKETRIWTSTNTAEFRSGDAFREFVKLLAKRDKDAACDSLNWSYLVKTSSNEYAVCVDMDEGALFNDYSDFDEINVGEVHHDTKYGCGGKSVYAERDIRAGEEFRLDYGTFCEEEYNALGMCQWADYDPSQSCVVAAKETYMKNEAITKRILSIETEEADK